MWLTIIQLAKGKNAIRSPCHAWKWSVELRFIDSCGPFGPLVRVVAGATCLELRQHSLPSADDELLCQVSVPVDELMFSLVSLLINFRWFSQTKCWHWSRYIVCTLQCRQNRDSQQTDQSSQFYSSSHTHTHTYTQFGCCCRSLVWFHFRQTKRKLKKTQV